MCVFCDNTCTINLSKNPVQHSKSKHIEIGYHFIRDLVEEKIVRMEFINTDNQKADIFTKPLDGPQFESLRKTIGVSIIPWLISLMCLYLIIGTFMLKRSHMLSFVSFKFFCLFTLFLLILLYLFYFWVCWKIQKLIKSEKSQKFWSLVLCISHVSLA